MSKRVILAAQIGPPTSRISIVARDNVMRLAHMMVILTICLAAMSSVSIGASEDASQNTKEEAPKFAEAFLKDPKVQEQGEAVWQDQCRHCHGSSAYPGKAPKLKPYTYEPEFVYDRVTNGIGKMPGWKDVYSKEERMAVTAYILSENFFP